MTHDLILRPTSQPVPRTPARTVVEIAADIVTQMVPDTGTTAGRRAARRFLEFFTAQIENDNTRRAYLQATTDLAHWCNEHGLSLERLNPVILAGYFKQLRKRIAVPTVKQHLAAIRMLFDWLVTGHVIETNPATSVRGPKHVVTKGTTPVLEGPQAQALIDAIRTDTIGGLRDRAMIGVMVYSFARVGALVAMNVEYYYGTGKRWWFRLH